MERKSEDHLDADRLRNILDCLPQMIWVHGFQPRFQYYNAQWLAFTGSDAPGDPNFQRSKLIHPEDKASALAAWERAQSTGRYEAEYRLRHRAGDYRWIFSRGVPERDVQGTIVCWYGTCTDIHDRILSERKLYQLQNELTQMSRASAVGMLAKTLAHELNQPLAAAHNYLTGSKRLVAAGGREDTVMEAIDSAQKQIARSGEIIRRARDTLGIGGMVREEVDLRELVDEALILLRTDETCRDAAIELSLDERCGKVRVDRVQIEQVFTNLLRNACQAMKDKDKQEKSLRISSTMVSERWAEVAISDRGPGIADEQGERLFQPFGGSSTGGLGLGLSISQAIIEGHEGEIKWRNNPEGGATFCFTLPLAGPCRSSAAA